MRTPRITGMHTARERPIQNFAFLERPGREAVLDASGAGEEGFTGVTGKQGVQCIKLL
jgi:hypothetical protein